MTKKVSDWTHSLNVKQPLGRDGSRGWDSGYTPMYNGGVAVAKKALKMERPWEKYSILSPNAKITSVSVYRGGRFHGRIKADNPDLLLQFT